MDASGEAIRVERPGPATAVVTLNRPEKRNAMTLAMWRALRHIVESLGAEPELRAVVLTGAGGAFCAGADIAEFAAVRATPEAGAAYAAAVDACQEAIAACPKATFAAVSGPAFGGGVGLALACDFRVADATARFAIPAARLGLVYGLAETRAVLNAAGLAAAKDLLFSGRTVAAAEAAALGLATRLAAGDALTAALDDAAALAAAAPLSIAGAKAVLAALTEGPGGGRAEAAAEAAARALASADYVEGRRAFAERRAPRFTGA
jgi:enoyl-CoA hydratase/carnithine racemase